MTWPAILAIVLASLGLFTVGFLTLWHRVTRELRAMEPRETIAEHKRRSWR